MRDVTDLKLVKWPFFLGNAMLLALAILIYSQHGHAPMRGWEVILFVLSGALGAVLGVLPFLFEYQAAVKMVETGAVVSTLSQIRDVEEIARQITGATAQWQGVQEHSQTTAAMAKEIAGSMAAEVAAFKEFMHKANDTERANLRLEVEKLRRAEGEFLQVIVRMLDHTYALHQAAVRSGQPGLIENLAQFQAACRDAARRIGLTPFVPGAGDPFDPKLHQLADPKTASPDAKIRDALSTGLTYQGQLIRPALVSLQVPTAAPVNAPVDGQLAASAEVHEALDRSAKKDEELEEQSLL